MKKTMRQRLFTCRGLLSKWCSEVRLGAVVVSGRAADSEYLSLGKTEP